MDVYFPVSIGNRPAWFIPFQHPEWPSFHVALLQEAVEELLRLGLQTPMVWMEWHILSRHASFKKHGRRQGADCFLDRLSEATVPFGEIKSWHLVFPLVEAHNEHTLSHLSDAEVLRIQFALENRESCRGEEFLEVVEEFSVCFVSQAENVLEHEEIQAVMSV